MYVLTCLATLVALVKGFSLKEIRTSWVACCKTVMLDEFTVDNVCFTIENSASMASSSLDHFSATGISTGRICSTTGISGWARGVVGAASTVPVAKG